MERSRLVWRLVMAKPRSGTSYRLSEDAQDLLGRLANRLGLTKTGVVEMAIRKLAYAELGGEEPTSSQQGPARLRRNAEPLVAGYKN
jgi:hypothetical protein